jgi:nucleotide-binding universal stress UspA family protein
VRRARGILGAAFTAARRTAPGLAVSTRSSTAAPVDALISAAASVRLLVVGIPTEGTVEILPTSVALNVAARASCPVAVVRGRISTPDAPVLVGIEDPDADERVLAAAFAEARLHRCGLAVLHAHGSRLDRLPGADPEARPPHLTAALNRWSQHYPEVAVTLHTPHKNATTALLAAAHRARLVAVGTRRHSAAARALFGSHSRAVLRYSPVPVLVVDPAVRPATVSLVSPSTAPGRLPAADPTEMLPG